MSKVQPEASAPLGKGISRVQALMLSIALSAPSISNAWETDQHTLPEKPLVDVSAEVSRYVFKGLQQALKDVNTAVIDYPDELEILRQHPAAHRNFILSVNPRRSHRARVNDVRTLRQKVTKKEQALVQFSSKNGIVSHVADLIGRPIALQEKIDAIFGLPTSFSREWAERSDYVDTYFRPGNSGHVYALAGFHRGLHAAYFILSSTIRLHDTEMGIDKLGHFFNEGHSYYEQYSAALEQGRTAEQAMQAAVKWGIDSEAGIFGLIASGVYSNADLAANFAGLHFYINLFQPITVSGTQYPAMIERVNGQYRISARYQEQWQTLMQRFISNHMNEALNPSRLEKLQYLAIKSAIESRCEQWLQRWPERDRQWYAKEREKLSRWHGADYGHDSENTWPLDQVCFPSEANN